MIQRNTRSYELPVTDSCSWRRIYSYHLLNKEIFCASPDKEPLLYGFPWNLKHENHPFLKCLEVLYIKCEPAFLDITMHHFVLYFSLDFAPAGKHIWFKYFKSLCSLSKLSFFHTKHSQFSQPFWKKYDFQLFSILTAFF